MPRPPYAIPLALFLLAPQAVWPEAQSLFRSSTFASSSGSLIQPPNRDENTPQSASLFIGIDGTSFFRPYPVRRRPSDGAVVMRGTGSAVMQLRHLIGQAESRVNGYDAVQHGARIRPTKKPTDMTVGEIYAWINATPGQPHAIGRYQFIPSTLRGLVTELGVPQSARFTPQLQDQLADVLLVQAGYNAFLAGALPRHSFMNNLARIWAGLPNSTGKSHYEGYAGNSASITWARFDAEMKRIFPS